MNTDSGSSLRPATLPALFLTCLRIGALSFGGGLSGWLHREFVHGKKWIGEDDFASTMAIAQMLPGANVVNLVVCMGEQLRGPLGAATCLFGFLIGPFFAVIAFGAMAARIGDATAFESGLVGVAAAATGLLIVVGWHGVRRSRHWPQLVVMAAVILAVGVMEWPLLPVVALVAPISVAIAWKRRSVDAR